MADVISHIGAERSSLRPSSPDGGDSARKLEAAMRLVSIIVSAAALALMIYGLSGQMPVGGRTGMLTIRVLPLNSFIHMLQEPAHLFLMSFGIVLLGLIPIVRVIVALGLFLRSRKLDALVAAVVLCELVFSIYLGK